MITVEKRDGMQLRLTHVQSETKERELEVFLFVPGELDLSPHVLTEDDFYHSAIHSKQTYYSNKNLLPLVHSRLASRGKLSTEQYRLSLSLYAYQYVLALEKTAHSLLHHPFVDKKRDNVESEDMLDEAYEANEYWDAVIDAKLLAESILRKLRRNIPSDKKLLKYFENIDNYLSWTTEQQFLALIAHLPRGDMYPDIKDQLMETVQSENHYREEKRYNSRHAMRDPTRMSNKMRLLRRLIEYPVTLREKTTELGGTMNKIVKGSATAIVMLFVSYMILQAQWFLKDVTALFIVTLSGIYALREVFKDDLKNALWRWIRKGRPKWQKTYFDSTSSTQVGRKREWLEYLAYNKLDETIQKARRGKVSQREEVILHYKSESKLSITKFLSGYEQTREAILFDLRAIARLMEKGSQRIYRLKEDKVIKESVEKRHLINLITRTLDDNEEPVVQRWKIVMTRSKIVDIESIEQASPSTRSVK
ncbi:hypothetical protein [Thaumasiovibrio subtropicus]|uniref:hypothetical protein n=1 Tax=Thaumasiovibrio subtropicus TaxID=1891207 RepID=UPI000B35F33D|nr:hypothetical protein [Thaumasiovibrio subtropicus]